MKKRESKRGVKWGQHKRKKLATAEENDTQTGSKRREKLEDKRQNKGKFEQTKE